MRIGIISGHFFLGLAQPGHLDYIKDARKKCDFLVCIPNNEEQCLQKYGFNVLTDKEKVEILKSCLYIDEVVLSIDNDRSVNETLKMIVKTFQKQSKNLQTPYFTFINSGDIKKKDMVREYGMCNQLGISVDFIEKEKINSTSNIIKKIKEEANKIDNDC